VPGKGGTNSRVWGRIGDKFDKLGKIDDLRNLGKFTPKTKSSQQGGVRKFLPWGE
jgi:hypothetical protein